MKLENEVCRKVYDHHNILKGELSSTLLDVCTRAGLTKEAISTLVNVIDSNVDTSTDRMINDYQRTFKSAV